MHQNYAYYLHIYGGVFFSLKMFAGKLIILSTEQDCYICSIIFK